MSPSDCVTEQEILHLDRAYADYVEFGKYSMLLRHDGAVILTEQESGKPAAASITIPRRQFQAMFRWYHREQEQTEK